MKKTIILVALLAPQLGFASSVTLGKENRYGEYPVFIDTNVPIYTASLKVNGPFRYDDDLIPLNVPEYNNDTVKTAGIPGGGIGRILFGFTRTPSIEGLFTLDENGKNILQ